MGRGETRDQGVDPREDASGRVGSRGTEVGGGRYSETGGLHDHHSGVERVAGDGAAAVASVSLPG